MKRLGALASCVLVVLLGAVLVACGGAPADVGFTSTLYSNQDYGFSIEYPAGFTKAELPANSADAGAPKLDVIFVDPQGAQISGKAVDTLETAVYQMNAAPKASDFTAHKKEFQAMLVELVGKLPHLKIAKPLTWSTVDGRPAVAETYTYAIGGKDLAASSQLVFKDALAYLVRAQASRATWPTTGRELVSCMATFQFL
jgi:hypothetical protein